MALIMMGCSSDDEGNYPADELLAGTEGGMAHSMMMTILTKNHLQVSIVHPVTNSLKNTFRV